MGGSARGRGRASAARGSGGEDEGWGYAALAAKKKGMKQTGKQGVPSDPGDFSLPRQAASTDCKGLGAAANGRPTPLEAIGPPVADPAIPTDCQGAFAKANGNPNPLEASSPPVADSGYPSDRVGPEIAANSGPGPEATEQLHEQPEAESLRSPVFTGTPTLNSMFRLHVSILGPSISGHEHVSPRCVHDGSY